MTPDEKEQALKLIFVARDRLVWDYAGRHPAIAIWDKIERVVQEAPTTEPSSLGWPSA